MIPWAYDILEIIGKKLWTSWEEEEGQSMVLAAITMLVLAMFIVLSFNLADIASRKIQIQNAADAAAYSGAVIEANSLNTIAWLNDGMTFIFYNLFRYSIDKAVFETMAKFKGRSPSPSDQVIGTANIRQKARQADQIYREWVGRGVGWLRQLREMEDIIVKTTPQLIRKEVIEVALANGADGVALIPDPKKGVYGPFSTMEQYLDKKIIYMAHPHERLWFHRMEKKYGNLPLIRSGKLSKSEWAYFQGNGEPKVAIYYQIRTCWNLKDLAHRENHGGGWNFFTGNSADDAPSGHWHLLHMHWSSNPYNPIPIIHKMGHDPGHPPDYINANVEPIPSFGEPYKEDILGFPFVIPTSVWPVSSLGPYHHAIQICPTCLNLDFDSFLSKFLLPVRDGEKGKSDFAYFFYRRNFHALTNLPAPYVLNDKFFQSRGLVVMTWQKPSQTTLLQNIFTTPKQGIFAMAYARVGVWKTEKHASGKEVYLWGNLVQDLANQQLTEPIEFGARLAPIAYIPNLSQVLNAFENKKLWNGNMTADLKDLGPAGKLRFSRWSHSRYWAH